MIKFSRIGAAAMALALSVTFITAPTAAVNVKAWGQGSYNTYQQDPIDKTVTTSTITGTGTTQSEAELAMYNDGKAKGVYVDGTYGNNDVSMTDANGNKVYFKLVDGYSVSKKYDKATKTYTGTVKYTTYKHLVTGETSTDSDDITSIGNKSASIYGISSKYTVYKGSYGRVYVSLRNGDTQIKNLKSSNKKAIQAKITAKDVYTTTDEFEVTASDEKGFYYSYDGSSDEEQRIYVPEKTKVNTSSADITIQLYAKKNGKSVISFDVYNKDGVKTGKAKFTVVANEEEPFTSVTFAGKSLIKNKKIGAADSKYIYAGKDSNSFYAYTTKKSGKFKVTPSKNIRIEKIYVGTLKAVTTSYLPTDAGYADDNYDTADATKSTSWTRTSTEGSKVDLNGDGDFDDIVNGVSESNVTFTYKTVKNGKKITLSKVPYYTTKTRSESYTNKADATASTSFTRSQSDKSDAIVAPTMVRVIYYDRIAKSYGEAGFVINKKIAK